MFVSKVVWDIVFQKLGRVENDYDEQRCVNHEVSGENIRLKIENQRLVSTLEWFKHRLTQVEMERAQLIYAATGGKEPTPSQAKINYPNFVGEPVVSDVLNAQNNPFGTLGEDSLDPADQIPAHAREAWEDVSGMPERKR